MDGWQGDAKGEIKLIYSVPRIIYVKVSMYMYIDMFVSCVQLGVYSLYTCTRTCRCVCLFADDIYSCHIVCI
jgi:hypothetical protein